MRPVQSLPALLSLAILAGACDSEDETSEVEAMLSVDPRFVQSLETGPLVFDVSGSATVGEGTRGMVSVYVSRSNAEGCIGIAGANAQDEGPFIDFDATADIYRFEVDASSFEVEIEGTCMTACTADAAAEFSLIEGDGSMPGEPLLEATFFNINCAEL